MTLYFVIVPIVFVMGLEFGLWLRRVRDLPECICDEPDCGGGCIDWEPR